MSASSTLIKRILAFVNHGWKPYNREPSKKVYDKIDCPNLGAKGTKKPLWFVREDMLACVTCNRPCVLSQPKDFYLPLPLKFQQNKSYHLNPKELITHKALLRIDEAAYCLNVSDRLIYDWIAEGKLRKTKIIPVRIPSEDVAALMREIE
ncbi:MAG: helix-turn-helix domain-containing protein [Desulfarculales bacterium]|jgi:excisionase family DNA binding protein|nr:helix-turn-helix domain-containing protein [Desulfarculales bacterium]